MTYEKWLNSKNLNNKTIYKEEHIKYRNAINKNKNDTWERKCKEDCYIGGTKASAAWKLIRTLKTDNINKINIQPIRINAWKQHYSEQLKEDRTLYLTNFPKSYQVQGQRIDIEEMMWRAIKSMKNARTSGPERIPAELVKCGTQKLVTLLREPFTRYLNGEKISRA